ncbi:MAG TPA: DEAD/DEAH box helicase [Candidatus Limnocylindrales bacterium]|nr:DEAD/DEAH box helicase [Candidatus Limnocylindrales bacterium]
MSFDGLGLSPELLRAVSDEGYTEPTPVQAAAIPVILEGRDVLAGAQTGTGKTAAFVLPVIQYLHATRRDAGEKRHPIRVLVVVPTRELCLQVEESTRTYGKHRPIRSAAVYGGVGFGPQVSKLRAGPEIVVATPGRLLDHVSQRTIDLSAVEVLILDEADRMLDMGFIRDIRKILALLPPKRQNLLFSATFSDDIRGLADGLLHDPVRIQVTPRNTTAELIDQLVIPVDRERKRDLLRELVALGRVKQALVFTRTKHGANRLAQQLEKDGIKAAAIHGNKSQAQRVRALDDFKAGRVDLLVATDVAARGIDIEQLPHVINFELPMVPEDYVHRIGRTGRAGVDGQAISLVCVDEKPLLQEIQQLLRRAIPTEEIAGFEPDRSIRPQPIRLRSTPAERAETAANRAAARTGDGAGYAAATGGRGGRTGAGRGRPGAGRPSVSGAYGSGPSRHAAPQARGEDGFVARPARPADGPQHDGGGGGRGGRGRRRSGAGRGQGSSVPGSGFGNGPARSGQGTGGQPGYGNATRGGGTRAGGGRPAGPRPGASRPGGPAGGAQGQRPGSGGHGARPDGETRVLPGERIRRLG